MSLRKFKIEIIKPTSDLSQQTTLQQFSLNVTVNSQDDDLNTSSESDKRRLQRHK